MSRALSAEGSTLVLDTNPQFTVVIPTRNEAENVGRLLSRLNVALAETDVEVVFVDDSDDDTAEKIRRAEEPGRLRLLHRPRGQRRGGLGGAVVSGIAAARAPWVIVMDGDLQHPPEVLPAMIEATRDFALGADDGEATQEISLIRGPVDVVVASRYTQEGSADGLGGVFRRWVSRLSGNLAKAAFPRRLRRVTDPMSGFFAVRRAAVDVTDLRPQGYKILLEILVRGRIERVAEVPYTFRPREAGTSKATLREGLRFGRHVAGLRLWTLIGPWSQPGRAAGFAAAGAAAVRRSTRTRFALAFLLTVAAFPNVAVGTWNGLWARDAGLSLLIPLAAALALLAGRLKPCDAEPKVHDRQVDGLIGVLLLAAAVVVTALRASANWSLVGVAAYLAGGTVLLLGTRTAARLRWALVLPLVAIDEATPAALEAACARLVRLGSGPEVAAANGPALAGALLCLTLCALGCFGVTRRLAIQLAVGLPALSAVAVATPAVAGLVDALVGPGGESLSAVPAVFDVTLAVTVALFAWRWSRIVAVPPTGRRHYAPRARLAVIALTVVALALGGPGSPLPSAFARITVDVDGGQP